MSAAGTWWKTAAFAMACCCAVADGVPADKSRFHVFLLCGQSNMAGRGRLAQENRLPSDRVLKMDSAGEWVPCDEPIHFDVKMAGAGLGMSFARTLADADPSIVVGLVPCAFSGSRIADWRRGRPLFTNAVARAKLAAKAGRLKGILWHQGEAESWDADRARLYGAALSSVATDFRDALGDNHLPFIAGELGDYLAVRAREHKKGVYWADVNAQIRKFAETTPFAAFAAGDGLSANPDGLHADTASLRKMGERYAAAYRELMANPPRGLVPSIIGATPFMNCGRLAVRARLRNPIGKNQPCRLVVRAGALAAETNVVLRGYNDKNFDLTLPEVPADFDLSGYDWSVSIATPAGTNACAGRADASAAVGYLAGELLSRQAQGPDGRYSNYFFGDVYGARALMALGQKMNRPDWAASGRRWVEEALVARQFPDGGYPMGYLEKQGVHWVPDNGTAALGVLDAAARDSGSRERLLASVRRYIDYRASFYQDAEKAKALRERYGDSELVGEGLYGLGVNNGDYWDHKAENKRVALANARLKKGEKPLRTIPQDVAEPLMRVERGASWVNAISLLPLPAYAALARDPDVLRTADRDLGWLTRQAKTVNYFGAETISHCFRYLPPSENTARAEALMDGFMESITHDRNLDAALGIAGRRTLEALPALYELRRRADPAARVRLRTFIACRLWFVASREFPRSVWHSRAVFDGTYKGDQSAARYELMSIVWLAELLFPECTLPCGATIAESSTECSRH